jgi:hypothetical protein
VDWLLLPSTALLRGNSSITIRMGFSLSPKITRHSLAKPTGLLQTVFSEVSLDTGLGSPVLKMAGVRYWIKLRRFCEGLHIKTRL